MSDSAEHIIRQWGRSDGDGPQTPAPPTERCLTFEQAAAIARSAGLPDGEARRHLAECPRCRGLLADFRDALAEGAPREGRQAAAPATRRREAPDVLSRPIRSAMAAAAAAILLLTVGSAIYLARRPSGPILVVAEVGLRDDILAGMAPKAARTFATGDAIMFRVDVGRAGRLMLINIDPNGTLEVLEPIPLPSADGNTPVAAVQPGVHNVGPYRLAGNPGEETFLVIGVEEYAAAKWDRLTAAYEKDGDVEKLIRAIRDLPAEVKVIRIDHVAKRD